MDKIYYILKDEGHEYIFREIRKNTDTASSQYDSLYRTLWDKFTKGVILILQDMFSQSPCSVILHRFSLKVIRERISALVAERDSVSFDPCVPGDFNLGASRIFRPGENVNKEIGSRPGYEPLSNQIHTLTLKTRGEYPLVLIEDDIYTGNTIKSLISRLKEAGINIEEIIATFQIGNTDRLGTALKAVYKFPREEVLDLNDLRDFVMGGYESGLVIAYPDGKVKVPYFLPFCSPHARLSIPPDQEIDFSKRMLELNMVLFSDISRKIGEVVLLAHVNPFFQRLMLREAINLNTPMHCVCQNILDRLTGCGHY